MNRLPLRVVAAAAVLFAAVVLAFVWPKPQLEKADFALEAVVPTRFAGWQIDPTIIPVSPTPDVQAQLEKIYEQTVARTYVNQAGQRVMLSIAYGGDQRDALSAHNQEVCYRAQGFIVTGLSQRNWQVLDGGLEVTQLLATQGRRSEPVTYWLTMGENTVSHRGERLRIQVTHGLRHGTVPDGMLVRVSSLDADPAQGFALQKSFIDALMSAMPPADARRLLGRST